eukprot:TRINITY_DN2499_c0_g3_i4.p1 TRINITY_DN2499_c0_g3~~TRINITY_DN2499_c0_g3_i4.p1  ORF type:complete len:380 (+),score=137.16 TRINITY_DN2499_c0_g3_i4:507-1646(+)
MNVRLKLANKEQKMCSNKMAENPSESEADRTVDEAGADLPVENQTEKDSNTTTEEDETETVPEGGNDKEATTPSEHSKRESEDSTEEKDDDAVSAESSPKQNTVDEPKVNASEGLPNVNDSKTDEEKQKESDESKGKHLNKEDSPGPSYKSSHDDEKTIIVSKLDADALSASLSSSKCLLKRNRDDLDSDDDDSGEEAEEPFSKKSHIGEVTPKHVSKLKSTELLASMSSSKSLLKRGIEKVDKANIEEATDAPESKKSNLAQTPKPEKDESSETVEDNNDLKHSKDIETPEENTLEVRIAPKTLKFPPSPTCQLPPVKTLPNPPTPEPERTRSAKEEPVVKEETRQKIGAKELAGERQLERKRLNKMLAIFDDQKIVR